MDGMEKSIRAFTKLALVLLIAAIAAFANISATGCSAGSSDTAAAQSTSEPSAGTSESVAGSSSISADSLAAAESNVSENGEYTGKYEVAAYIHRYGRLPGNFISKTKARDAGWVASQGNLQKVCPGKSIGGSRFYNDDGKLPDANGRSWKECDIDYHGGMRGAKRIVFSNDGLVFYTVDHYENFEQLY